MSCNFSSNRHNKSKKYLNFIRLRGSGFKPLERNYACLRRCYEIIQIPYPQCCREFLRHLLNTQVGVNETNKEETNSYAHKTNHNCINTRKQTFKWNLGFQSTQTPSKGKRDRDKKRLKPINQNPSRWLYRELRTVKSPAANENDPNQGNRRRVQGRKY